MTAENNKENSSELNQEKTYKPLTLGDYLHQGRLKKRVSLEQVSEITRVHINNLKALEDDDVEKFPAEVFTRGFIKIYTKYLGLEYQEALSLYADISTPEEAIQVKSTQDLAESPLRTYIFHFIALFVTMVILFLAYLFFPELERFLSSKEASELPVTQLSYEDKNLLSADAKEFNQKLTEPGGENKSAPSALAVGQQKVSEEDQDFSEQEAVADNEPVIKEAADKTLIEKNNLNSSPVESGAVVSSASGVSQDNKENKSIIIRPVNYFPKKNKKTSPQFAYTLKAEFSEITWTRVFSDEKEPVDATFYPGDIFTWQAKKMIKIKLGNNKGVKLFLNDSPYTFEKTGSSAEISIP
jgi:cytoskeletal protein RodZ